MGKEWTTVEKLSLFESQRALSSLFYAKLGFWAVVSLLLYGIPTLDSESFELELNGMPGGTYGSSFAKTL